jgi:ribosomal protein S18 acetylase RimI-like enzyme
VIIRPAVAGDEPTLAALTAHAHELHVAAHPEVFRPARLRDVTDWFAAFLKSPTAAAWIADDDGTAVGYATAQYHEQPESPFALARRWCQIDGLAVAPAHRRRGIARALIDAIVADASANGVRDIELNVWAFNEAAQAAFRRLGFAPRNLRMRKVRG